MSRFLCWTVFSPVSEIVPANPAVELYFLPRLVGLCWGEFYFIFTCMSFMVAVICTNCAITAEFELVRTALACASPSSSQPCDCIPWTIVCMSSINSCYSSGEVCGAPYIVCAVAVYPDFPAVVTNIFCYRCAWWKNNLYFAHVLRSGDFRLHSLMSSLKIPVCAIMAIPFDIIIASDIFWPPDIENSLPFSNCLIIWSRVSAGLYGPIILTEFSFR